MAKVLTDAEKQEIIDEISEFLSDELDVDLEDITTESKIIDDLGGDSMIYLELVEEFKKKYSVNVEVRVIGKYFQKHPVYTVGEAAEAVYNVIEKGDALLGEE